MKTKFNPSYDSKRQKLSEIIPLSTPFTIYLEPTRFCNLKCFYCLHSTRDELNGEFYQSGYDIKHISPKLFTLFINQIQYFPKKIKRLVFSGLGEPLMNPRLPEMVKEANKTGMFERIDVITNGVLLSKNFSNQLIKSGVTRIQISIQGLDSESYLSNCGIHLNYDEFFANLKYLYSIRGDATIFIKIIDSLLRDQNDKDRFFSLFNDICDTFFIEHLVSMEQQMGDLNGVIDNSKNLNNEIVVPRKVCSVPFYHLNINADGDVFPCPPPGLPKWFSYYNITEESLLNIWNGQKRNRFLKAQLQIGREKIKWCNSCINYNCISTPEENLDEDAHWLLEKISLNDR